MTTPNVTSTSVERLAIIPLFGAAGVEVGIITGVVLSVMADEADEADEGVREVIVVDMKEEEENIES